MESLPLEILLHIGTFHYTVWRGMLVVRLFAEYTLSRSCRSYVLRAFSRGEIEEKTTYLLGEPHSYFDQPAVIEREGALMWYKNGLIHRGEDKPAIIFSDGECHWFRDGKEHRDGDLPAEIHPRTKCSFHQNNDPSTEVYIYKCPVWQYCEQTHPHRKIPMIVYTNVDQKWYKNGLLHREGDLPAVIEDITPRKNYCDQCENLKKKYIVVTEQWYLHGKLYRENDKAASWLMHKKINL